MIIDLYLKKPSLFDNIADFDRILRELKRKLNNQNIEFDMSLVKKTPNILRNADYQVKCVLFNYKDKYYLIDIKNINDKNLILGLAIDIGTTTVVMRFINLENKQIVKEESFYNPQIKIGPDILTRILYIDKYIGKDEGINILNSLIIEALNNNIKNICDNLSILQSNIYILAIAGNTTMTHFLLGLNPHWIIREPYIPVINNINLLKACELGININKLGVALVFPNVGSYFGGDLISGILFSEIHKQNEIAILVDVGTNAEVVLGNKDFLLSCAGAAGPALEGGVSKIGTIARPGAIDKVFLDKFNIIKFETIGNQEPIGICGSGFIDLAACLFKAGIIDFRGKFTQKLTEYNQREHNIKNNLDNSRDDEKKFFITQDLFVTQAEIDSLIRSKAAMYSILTTITSHIGLFINNLELFYIAGTFGAYINPKSAISIGMIPDLNLDKYKVLGNSSLEGATCVLINQEKTQDIDRIVNKITYMELNVNQEFMNRFSAAKFLPHADKSLFPSINIK